MNDRYFIRLSRILICMLGAFCLVDSCALGPLSSKFGRPISTSVKRSYKASSLSDIEPSRTTTQVTVLCHIAWENKTCKDTSFQYQDSALAWISRNYKISLKGTTSSSVVSDDQKLPYTITNTIDFTVLGAK